MFISIFLWGLVLAYARSFGTEREDYEETKQNYCISRDESWEKIDDMLFCYTDASGAKHTVVKECEKDTFENSTEAKMAFCTVEGAKSIGSFNKCVNEKMVSIDPSFNSDNATREFALDKKFMLDLYECLTRALRRNMVVTDEATTPDEVTTGLPRRTTPLVTTEFSFKEMSDPDLIEHSTEADASYETSTADGDDDNVSATTDS